MVPKQTKIGLCEACFQGRTLQSAALAFERVFMQKGGTSHPLDMEKCNPLISCHKKRNWLGDFSRNQETKNRAPMCPSEFPSEHLSQEHKHVHLKNIATLIYTNQELNQPKSVDKQMRG